jgi:hypothetical protein
VHQILQDRDQPGLVAQHQFLEGRGVPVADLQHQPRIGVGHLGRREFPGEGFGQRQRALPYSDFSATAAARMAYSGFGT